VRPNLTLPLPPTAVTQARLEPNPIEGAAARIDAALAVTIKTEKTDAAAAESPLGAAAAPAGDAQQPYVCLSVFFFFFLSF
jgi:hypothetical protein